MKKNVLCFKWTNIKKKHKIFILLCKNYVAVFFMSFYDVFGIRLKHVYKLYITYIYIYIKLYKSTKKKHHKKYLKMSKMSVKSLQKKH